MLSLKSQMILSQVRYGYIRFQPALLISSNWCFIIITYSDLAPSFTFTLF